jgi:hypothetical protein
VWVTAAGAVGAGAVGAGVAPTVGMGVGRLGLAAEPSPQESMNSKGMRAKPARHMADLLFFVRCPQHGSILWPFQPEAILNRHRPAVNGGKNESIVNIG